MIDRRTFLAIAGAPLLAPLVPALRALAQDRPALADRYLRLILRFGPGDALIAALRYEGNNVSMRGPRRGEDDARPFVDGGAQIAERWRSAASSCALVFALRDTLFSQQDHPIDHAPRALLLPPSWVSVAVEHARGGRAIAPMQTCTLEHDAGWAALDDAAIFGAFPSSSRLAELARRSRAAETDPDARDRITHARTSLRSLASDVSAMCAAVPSGPEAVALAGAARIAASDRAYFGGARARTSLIFVENPNAHERDDEGKGMIPPGMTLDPESVAIARRAVYAARLADGDLSIERYDLTIAAERARAIAVAEALVPRGAALPGGTIWIWGHAGYDGHSGRGPDPLPHVPRFRRELARARIDRSRVRLMTRPSLELPGGSARSAALEAALDRYARADLPLSVHIGTRALERAISGT